MSRPLYRRLLEVGDLYGSLWPGKLALLLETIADEIETRGNRRLDLDPGEVADWLHVEAQAAKEGR